LGPCLFLLSFPCLPTFQPLQVLCSRTYLHQHSVSNGSWHTHLCSIYHYVDVWLGTRPVYLVFSIHLRVQKLLWNIELIMFWVIRTEGGILENEQGVGEHRWKRYRLYGRRRSLHQLCSSNLDSTVCELSDPSF
jgi:hypothetical protein